MPYGIGGKAYFWQDTLVTERATVVVYYDNGMLVPTVYIRGGPRVYPAPVVASLFMGPDAQDERTWEMGLIAAALGSSANAASAGPATDPVFEKSHPVLFAFMTVLEEEGKARSPSSLVVFAEDGIWKGCLTEKDANLKLWRTGETLQKLLASLEKALASGQADWRRGWAPDASKGRSRAKK